MTDFPKELGCPKRESYSQTRSPSATRIGVLKGRPRYRPFQRTPSYLLQCQFDWDDQQFQIWQSFWQNDLEGGTLPWEMNLQFSGAELYNSGDNLVSVKAAGPWQAECVSSSRWVVSLSLEVKHGTVTVLATFCPVVWPGEITDNDLPNLDYIYGGPINDLAADYIGPCDKVFGL